MCVSCGDIGRDRDSMRCLETSCETDEMKLENSELVQERSGASIVSSRSPTHTHTRTPTDRWKYYNIAISRSIFAIPKVLTQALCTFEILHVCLSRGFVIFTISPPVLCNYSQLWITARLSVSFSLLHFALTIYISLFFLLHFLPHFPSPFVLQI